jgi:hypothetical protein
MKQLSNQTKIYILLTVALGLGLFAWQLGRLEAVGAGLALLAALGAAAQTLKVVGPTERSSYNLSWVVYGFSFLLLGAPAAVVVIVAAHLVEWLRYRYPWYIQLFNMASYVVVATLAGLANALANPGGQMMTAGGALGALLAALVFTFLNHLLVGLVVKLARGQGLAESGVFERLALLMDLTMFGVGVASALLWLVNPLAVLFNLVPLYLFYQSLKVPALERQVAELEAQVFSTAAAGD